MYILITNSLHQGSSYEVWGKNTNQPPKDTDWAIWAILGPYDPIAPFCATIYSNNAWKGSLSLVEMRTQPSFSPS